jgi:hypothetical protein
VVRVTLERVSSPGHGVVKLRFSTCPCGYEFDDGESRSQHFADDHTPADFGLDAPSGGYAADGGDVDDV